MSTIVLMTDVDTQTHTCLVHFGLEWKHSKKWPKRHRDDPPEEQFDFDISDEPIITKIEFYSNDEGKQSSFTMSPVLHDSELYKEVSQLFLDNYKKEDYYDQMAKQLPEKDEEEHRIRTVRTTRMFYKPGTF